jgi:hypothetical protein
VVKLSVCLGGIIFAPLAHGWYNKVLNPVFPGSTPRAIGLKVLCDQTAWALAINCLYLGASSMLNGKTLEQSKAVVTSQIWPVMKANW